MMLEKITTLLKTGSTYNLELAHQLSISTKTSLWPLERGIKDLLYQAHTQPKIHFDHMLLGQLVYVLKEVIALSLNQAALDTLPEQVYFLPNLRVLEIIDTPIKSLPNSLGELTALKSLTLQNTCLKELPDAVFKLPKLERLHLLGNSALEELPASLALLKSLKTLRISKEVKIPDLVFDFEIIRV